MTANYCPECGGQLIKGNTFCGECGHKIIKEEAIVEIALKHCTSCDYSTKEDEQFCPECGGALTSTKNEDAKLNPQVQVPRKKKTRQFAKTITAHPVRKKKGGVLRTLRRVVLWGFAFVVLIIVGLYFIGDNVEDYSSKTFTQSDTTIPGIVDVEQDEVKLKPENYSKPNLNRKSTLVETSVNTDTAEVVIKATEDISIILPIALLETEEKLVVKELNNIQLPNGQNSDIVLDISLGNQHEFDDFIEILITPPSGFNPESDYVQCLSMSAGDKNWEPVMAFYEPEINKVRIVTDHLSGIAMIPIRYNATNLVIDPMFTVATETYKYFKTIASNDAITILKGCDAERVSKTLNKDYHVLSWNTVMDVYGLAGTGLSFMENGAGMSGLSKIGEAAGNIGIALSVIQIALDAHNGKTKAAQVGVYKTFLNTVVSKGFNTRAMNLALIGVFAIDYSLTTFANEAWAGRKALYETIWDNYQKRQRKKKINLYWWKKQIIVGMEKAKDPSKFESVVEGIITKYIEEFWNDETEIALIQSEVGPIFSAGGGLNEKMKKELSADFRLQILQYTQALLQSLQKQYILKARKELSLQRLALAKELNLEQLIRCEVVLDEDEKPDKYDQLKVEFEVAGNEMKKMWQGILNKDAIMVFYCTAAGYIGGEMPSSATLFIPEDEQNEKFKKIKAKVELQTNKKVTHVYFNTILDFPYGQWSLLYAKTDEPESFFPAVITSHAEAIKLVEKKVSEFLHNPIYQTKSSKFVDMSDFQEGTFLLPLIENGLYSYQKKEEHFIITSNNKQMRQYHCLVVKLIDDDHFIGIEFYVSGLTADENNPRRQLSTGYIKGIKRD